MYRIGDWELLPDRNLLRRGDTETALEPRLVQVLAHLADRPGEVVSRDDLLVAVWGDTVVQEEALTQAVSQLRRALGDDPRAPTYIETIPKRGYRLVAIVSSPVAAAAPVPESAAATGGPMRPLVALLAVVALVAMALVLVRGRTVDAPIEPLAARPLTSRPGVESQPALSPDGAFVAYVWRSTPGAAASLQLLRIGGNNHVALTAGTAHDGQPAWSPDGERLAFVRRDDAGTRLCAVAAIGGPVTDLGPRHAWFGGLQWTPDGAAILYSAKDVQESPMRLLRLNLADASVDTLTRPDQISRGDLWPRLSPDGDRLAFVRSDHGGSRRVWVGDATGAGAVPVSPAFFQTGGLTWSPDGRALIASADLRGSFDLWRVDPAQGAEAPHLIPLRGTTLLSPTWSQVDGPLVCVDYAQEAELLLGRLDAEALPVPVAPSTRVDREGRLSPDGQRLAFISDREGTPELWLHDLVGGETRRLSDFAAANLREPRWSPDGRLIAVNVARDGWLHVVAIDVASGLVRTMTSGERHHRIGPWSADGQRLFYSYEDGADWRIASVRRDGDDPRDDPAPGCHPLGESPDGRLYYFKETADGIFGRDTAGTESLATGTDAVHDLNHLQVTPDGYWFVATDAEGDHLAFCAFADGSVTHHADLPANVTGEIHVAPDGAFVCTAVTRTAGDLLMVPPPVQLD